MFQNKKSQFLRVIKSYRLTPILAHRLQKKSTELSISESRLVRSLLESALNSLSGVI